ncbi:hypothetical protein RBU61_08370 [Tissierella sp. MB52-C2]|uniref:hypothetical protein n=1 Tax=Tissierella sp. MB52-C2 TaxID=3070999 RepID=UPI00280B1867|nr:hypothetical protein [Tissierella sp. MB52-C2]WMM26679.1 hypothetical protein RBU61_08370 [Tissierella sp. MB52-C2]
MKFLIKVKNGSVHLFRQGDWLDEDLGELKKTISGKLVTKNFFGPNYELEDISGFFSKGQKYKISGDDVEGVLVKERGDRYKYIEE